MYLALCKVHFPPDRHGRAWWDDQLGLPHHSAQGQRHCKVSTMLQVRSVLPSLTLSWFACDHLITDGWIFRRVVR